MKLPVSSCDVRITNPRAQRPSVRFRRSALTHILRNRFYVGELLRNGQVFQGRLRERRLAQMLPEVNQIFRHYSREYAV
jgi:hypothetical protein